MQAFDRYTDIKANKRYDYYNKRLKIKDKTGEVWSEWKEHLWVKMELFRLIRLKALSFWYAAQKVMLSPHLAELYNIEPRVLVQAVKRNIDRFPVDFMFQLSDDEFANLKSQIVTSSWGGPRRAKPLALWITRETS